MKKKILSLLIITFSLSGCASDSWIYPLESQPTNEEVIQRGAKLSNPPMTLDEARNLVLGWDSILGSAARNRRYSEIAAKEMIFYGTLLAMGGIVGGSVALRNVGATIAGVGAVGDQHYQFGEQRATFARAARRMECARNVLDPLDPAVLDAIEGQTAVDLTPYVAATLDVPRHVNEYILTVRNDLRVALVAFSLSTPSRQEIESAMDYARKARDGARSRVPTVLAKFPAQSQQFVNQSVKNRACDGLENDKSIAGSRIFRACEISKQPYPQILNGVARFLSNAGTTEAQLEECLKLYPQ